MSPNEGLPQSGLTPLTPGAIPNRSPSMSELVELKLLCRDARSALEGVYGGIQTLNLGENYDHADEVMNEAGMLLDAITAFCQRSLKRMDEKKPRGRS